MQEQAPVELKRRCEAVRIPMGETVTLEPGTPVEISQTLGGTFTVYAEGGMFRIDAKDADALGMEASQPQATSAGDSGAGDASEESVWETLKTCYDPEIPVNIVDLGLIYDMSMDATASGQKRVDVKMTLTAPGCGMGPTIAGDAQQKLEALPGVEEAKVDLVWDPPWHPSMISAEGKRTLGIE